MIRLPSVEEQFDSIELTDKDMEALSKINIEKLVVQICPDERKVWKVTDKWGQTIKRYKTKEEAIESAVERNAKAAELGLWMRYLVAHDQGFDE